MKPRLLLAAALLWPCLCQALVIAPDVDVLSALGEPFHGQIALSDVGDLSADDIHAKLGSDDEFKQLGLENADYPSDLSFEVVVNSSGESYIDIRTAHPVNEPAINFALHVSWPKNDKLNDVAVLLDPPKAGKP